MASALVIAEARQSSSRDVIIVETCRHCFRLATKHAHHPLRQKLNNINGAHVHVTIQQCSNLVTENKFWPAEAEHSRSLLSIPEVSAKVPGISRKF